MNLTEKSGLLQGRSATLERAISVSKAESEPLRVLMAAGGTGGHIFPALAVARELVAGGRSDGVDTPAPSLVFLGTTRGLESRLVPAAGFPLQTVAAAGLKGIRGWKRLANFLVLPRSALAAARVLRDVRPHVVVGVGGYLAGPVMLEAALMGIPTLLIEPNAVPGFTNRVLAVFVRAAAVGFDAAADFYGKKARVTGHAVRQAFFEIHARRHEPPYTIVIVGGSQGARAINECMAKSFKILAGAGCEFRVVHQAGELDYNNVREMYRAAGIVAEVYPFIEDVPKAFERADLIVSRAGAAAVAELAAAGKAAILIPFPGATDQHQMENARVLERVGAARLIEQPQMTPELLASQMQQLLGSPELLEQMEQRGRTLARPKAAKEIADWIIELGAKG